MKIKENHILQFWFKAITFYRQYKNRAQRPDFTTVHL